MTGDVSSFVLPSGFNPFLAGQRLKEILAMLERLIHATDYESGLEPWSAFFGEPGRKAPVWFDEQANLNWQDRDSFTKEAMAAGITWETADSVFLKIEDAAIKLRQLAGEIRLWWTPCGRKQILSEVGFSELSDSDLLVMARGINSKILTQASAVVLPVVEEADRLSLHIWRTSLGHKPASVEPPAGGIGFQSARRLAEIYGLVGSKRDAFIRRLLRERDRGGEGILENAWQKNDLRSKGSDPDYLFNGDAEEVKVIAKKYK